MSKNKGIFVKGSIKQANLPNIKEISCQVHKLTINAGVVTETLIREERLLAGGFDVPNDGSRVKWRFRFNDLGPQTNHRLTVRMTDNGGTVTVQVRRVIRTFDN